MDTKSTKNRWVAVLLCLLNVRLFHLLGSQAALDFMVTIARAVFVPGFTFWGGAILRDIVLPLIRPATLVCLLLSFVRSLADFGTPIIIGGRFSTLAADIYLQVVGYSELEKSSAMNMFLLVPSILFFFVYRCLLYTSPSPRD